jgi:calcineurin-like phosphoesterase family protein
MQEMMFIMVDNWNSVVKPNDKVYHLGDTAFKNAGSLQVFAQLNGDKVLIKGNHDILKPSAYLQYFRDIRAYHVLDKILLAHIPVHPDSLARWKGQVHGHTHNNCLKDKRYYNVSVENINYTPVPFDTIRKYFNAL